MPRETPDQPHFPSLANQAMKAPASNFPSGPQFPSAQPVDLQSGKFDTQNLPIQSEPPDPQSARSHFLHSLLDSPWALDGLVSLFTEDERRVILLISFEADETPLAEDYAIFFDTLAKLNRLFLSVTRWRHFTRTWLSDVPIELFPFERLKITQITKSSPGKLEGSALAEVARSLSEALSLGDQLTKIRLSSTKVRDAKIEIEKKELELEELKRVAYRLPKLDRIEIQIERQRKLAELEELRRQKDEATRERRKLIMEDMAQQVELLGKSIPVLNSLPPELQNEFKNALLRQMDEFAKIPLVITDVTVGEEESDAVGELSSAT